MVLVAKRASIHPFFMYYREYLPRIPEKIRAAARFVASNQLRAPIAAVYPARRFEQALAHALAGGKVLLGFTDEGQSLTQRRQAMSHSISTLLTRNLRDVFGENDPARRRASIDELWTEDGVFYDPKTGVHRGRDEIDRIAGAVKATHPDFRYQPIAEPEELGDGGRVKWVSGRPGEAPAYAGTDFIIARDGRIAALYLFFDKLP